MGARSSSELGTSAQDGQQLLLFQKPSLRSAGKQAGCHAGDGMHSRRAIQDTLGVPARSALGSLVLRRQHQRLSRRVKAGEWLLWGPGGWDREGAPPFLRQVRIPTVLAPGQPLSNLSISRHKSHIGYRARARGLTSPLKAPIPYR